MAKKIMQSKDKFLSLKVLCHEFFNPCCIWYNLPGQKVSLYIDMRGDWEGEGLPKINTNSKFCDLISLRKKKNFAKPF